MRKLVLHIALITACVSLSATSAGAQTQVYWIDFGTGQMQRAPTDTGIVENVLPNFIQPTGIAFDPTTDKIYWYDVGIWRADLDGTHREELVTGVGGIITSAGAQFTVGGGLEIDGAAGKLYWVALTDPGNGLRRFPELFIPPIYSIFRSNLDGSMVAEIIPLGGVRSNIALDAAAGKIYFPSAIFTSASDPLVPKIQRANLDGSSVEDLVTGDSGSGLSLDVDNAKMYWVSGDTIRRADLDGSNIEDVLAPVLGSSEVVWDLSLDLGAGEMYWTVADFTFLATGGRIQRANLDGTNFEDVLTGISLPTEIALDAARSRMYFAEGAKLSRANLDGSDLAQLVAGASIPVQLAIDIPSGKTYWTDAADGTDGNFNGRTIRRADLDGRNVEEIFVTDANISSAIAFDSNTSKIYWIHAFGSSGSIRRADLDGTNIEELVTGIARPTAIALDTAAGKVYWSTQTAEVMRADLDGSNSEVLLTLTTNTANALAIDAAREKLYWATLFGRIGSADLDGSNDQELVTRPFGHGIPGIALDLPNGKMYWTEVASTLAPEPADPGIWRADLDGTNVEPFILGLVSPQGIAIVPEPADGLLSLAALLTVALLAGRTPRVRAEATQ